MFLCVCACVLVCMSVYLWIRVCNVGVFGFFFLTVLSEYVTLKPSWPIPLAVSIQPHSQALWGWLDAPRWYYLHHINTRQNLRRRKSNSLNSCFWCWRRVDILEACGSLSLIVLIWITKQCLCGMSTFGSVGDCRQNSNTFPSHTERLVQLASCFSLFFFFSF